MRRGLSLSGPSPAPQLGGIMTDAIRLQCIASGGDPEACKKAASGDFSGAVEVAGGQGGKAACEAASVPPEAAGMCGTLGSFVGKNIYNGMSELISPSAPCECQLGACNGPQDPGPTDDFNHDKFNILMSHCKSPVARAAIDKSVEDRVGPNGSERPTLEALPFVGKAGVDRLEICAKLVAYAECAKAPAAPPAFDPKATFDAAILEHDIDCKAKGFAGWASTLAYIKPDGSFVLNGGCETKTNQALIDCLGTVTDDAGGAACKAKFPDAVVPGATDGAHDGSGSGGSGAGMVVAAGLGLAAAYAGWRLYKGKKIF